MATSTTVPTGRTQGGSRGRVKRSPARRRNGRRPIIYWAIAGAFVAGLQLYVYGAWIATGKTVGVDAGATPLPLFMKIPGYFWTIVGLPALVATIYLVLVRPWRRERKVTLDGALLIGMLSMYWQDALCNYFAPFLVYNAGLPHVGVWYSEIPGWQTPFGGRTIEPLLAIFPMYGWLMLPGIVVVCGLMRKIKARWPDISTLRLLAITLVATCIADIILEPCLMLPTGLWIYPGAVRELSVFPGKYYQFPIYEFLFPLLMVVFGALRYFVNDRGHTVVERGVETLKVGRSARTGVRVLAIVGAVNILTIVLYNGPMLAIATHWGDPWPDDVLKRSYFNYHAPATAKQSTSLGPALPLSRPYL